MIHTREERVKANENTCSKCEALQKAEALAVAGNNQSEAADCRVLRRQHPNHDAPLSRKTFARVTAELNAPNGA